MVRLRSESFFILYNYILLFLFQKKIFSPPTSFQLVIQPDLAGSSRNIRFGIWIQHYTAAVSIEYLSIYNIYDILYTHNSMPSASKRKIGYCIFD